MDDLFDVFNEQPQAQDPAENTSKRPKKDKSKKRQANGQVKGDEGSVSIQNGENGHAASDSAQETDGDKRQLESETKRLRIDHEADPLVTDTFETEQSREVAPSAGLLATKSTEAVILSHQVRHQVALPPDYPYIPLSEHKPPEVPARTWPFTLDPFQQTSIASIEREESILVSAHTSAGKTVVAEYAIAQCLKNNQRVIYTSPIKALSNQKYREFLAEFNDVGLMTGDVTINPTATCLVMTTEILRSMLYRGSEIMREVGWVVFDEIHYLRDKVRGVVWEETIILLPDKVRYVFLSATIPNAMQFAEWITKTHNQPCHVVYTDFRPTPLQHYFFPAGADGIHLIVDEKGVFREDNFQKAMSTIAEREGDDPADAMAKRKGKGSNKKFNKGVNKDVSDIYKIVKMIMVKNYNPVIVFSFSKRDCETHALKMSSMTFNDENEKAMVSKVFESALGMLSEEDKKLPQIEHILPLLRRGIGIHHSGLLPILKEAIEILFQEGLIKVLFATETFSIGLNMPAKTVVFTNVRKFDGIELRWLTPSEFIQMSGRAGRRGLDDRGIVIMMIDEQMEPGVAKEVVRGEQDRLNSAFHLGYNMVLNLLRVEGISPEFMLERCFLQFQNTASVSDLERQLHTIEVERRDIEIEDENTIRDYYDLRKQLDLYAQELREVTQHPDHSLPFLKAGRLVDIQHNEHAFGWGVLCSFNRVEQPRGQKTELTPQQSWVLHVALLCSDEPGLQRNFNQELPIQPVQPGQRSKLEIFPVLLSTVQRISNVRIFMPPDLTSRKARDDLKYSLDQVEKRFPDGVSVLDPIEDLKITDDSFVRLLKKISVLESRLLSNPLHNSPRLKSLYDQYAEKMIKTEQVKDLRKKIQDALSIIQIEDLKCRKRVLRRLQFINEDGVVQLKARVACQISTGDELMLSELLFNGFFNDLNPEICAAVLSCFVFEEKTKFDGQLREDLAKPWREIQAQARLIAKVSRESKLALNEEEYVKSFKGDIMNVVYEWAHGKSFADICKMTEVYEGNLIRVFRRLEEGLRQMAEASKVMGNEQLEKKFDLALTKIRRDIVAAQSLYL